MWTREQQIRLALEKKLLELKMPQFTFHSPDVNTYISGCQRAGMLGNSYQLVLALPPSFPHAKPALYIVSPLTLLQHGRKKTVNSVGCSHKCHTLENGPGGCVQICHASEWSSSITCVAVFLKGIIWLDAYEAHLRTGKSIANLVDEMQNKLNRKTRKEIPV